MHELLLLAPVPFTRHAQILSILAGLAATQPIATCEQIQLYKPNRQPGGTVQRQVGAVQDVDGSKGNRAREMQAAMSGDLFYLRVVREMDAGWGEKREGSSRETGETVTNGVDSESVKLQGESMDVDGNVEKPPSPNSTSQSAPTQSLPKQIPPSTLQFRDLPEPTRARDRAVTSRFIADIPITFGSPTSFMSALDYSLVSVYYTEGHRLTFNNISLLLHRNLVPLSPLPAELHSSIGSSAPEIPRKDLKLLDVSGAYILQATVRVQDGSKVETMVKGMNELLALKETLRGAVELEMAERLALDTRVR